MGSALKTRMIVGLLIIACEVSDGPEDPLRWETVYYMQAKNMSAWFSHVLILGEMLNLKL